jgi:LPXTG-site transpeptidase (sortase) family protein
MQRLGNTVIVVGLVLLAYAVLWQLGLAPGSRVTLPEPVAVERAATRTASPAAVSAEEPTAVPFAARTAAPTLSPATPAPTAGPTPAVTSDARPAAPLPHAPDALDRHLAALRPPPGYAVRLAIPAIKLDTSVQQGGIVPDADGNPSWQTVPFVAVHYGDLTALIGAPGNAVIAGHVVTLREGNVFRFLYQLDIEDRIQVWDDHEREHDFRVVDVKLVPPSEVSVMASTPDETLTLITCGGTFDPIRREFSDRLIVTAKPL